MIQLRNIVVLGVSITAVGFAQPGGHGMGRGMGPGGPGDFAFVRPEFGFAGKVVTGAPYTAQAVTQFSQTLADGNHIQRTSTASVTRDSQGRTRRETSMAAIGPLAGSGPAVKSVFISDPVAGTSYMLDTAHKMARQMPAMRNRHTTAAEPGANSSEQSSAGESRAAMRQRFMANVKTEDLGTQVMEGLNVQGKRMTRTIPAARAGSDRDIQVVTETWTSPDLQMVIMSKTSDPRFGDSVYKLTNITRAEPDPSLFTVPSDYQIQKGRFASAAQ
jgi:hypothetical protein